MQYVKYLSVIIMKNRRGPKTVPCGAPLNTVCSSLIPGCAVAHSPVAIGNFGGVLECISMIAHGAIGNKIDNIMVVR